MTNMNTSKTNDAREYASWLWFLLAVFVCRVLAQFSLMVWDVPFLPPFEAWYSGAVPYTQLLISQILIILLMGIVAWRFSRYHIMAKRSVGILLLGLGALYFVSMLVRFVIGIAELSDLVWFNRPIPVFFHMILATFVMRVGQYHFSRSNLRGGKI